MLITIAHKIRRIASLIELDKTPTDYEIGGRKMLCECGNEEEPVVVRKQVSIEEEKITPTAPPQQRRPRKQPGHLNKWNEDTKTGLMKEYMQQYRADGKDKEVDGPKSTYKKKF